MQNQYTLAAITRPQAAVVAPPAPPPAQEQLPKVAQAPEPVVEPTPAPVEADASAAVVAPVQPPPPAGDNVMKIVLVGAECAPWSKTGGLGDVMSALPKALARRGHRVMVVVPRYANYDDVWDIDCRRMFRVFGGDQSVAYFHCFKDEVDYVFVDHPCYHSWAHNIYGGDRQDIQFRNALLCKVRDCCTPVAVAWCRLLAHRATHTVVTLSVVDHL